MIQLLKILSGLWLVFFCFISAFPQVKQIGKPFMVNHTRINYQASTQNWSIAQAANGFMYFGNNDGILEFDGTSWSLYPLNNQSVVRSLLAVGDTIFAGGFEEIGYLTSNKNGTQQWISLNHLIPEDYQNFDEVWRIFKDKNRIIFHSFSSILIYENDSFKIIEPYGSFGYMFQTDNGLLVADKKRGLFRLHDDKLNLISTDKIFLEKELSCIFSLDTNQLLIGTIYDGLYIFDKGLIKPFDRQVNAFLKNHSLFSATLFDSGFAFGTISNGIYLTDKNGNILQHLNRQKGLQNNTVLSVFKDNQDNLWLGLDNGIDYVNINSPITLFDHTFNIESTYSVLMHQGILYVGTNQGLYAAEFDLLSSVLTDEIFRLVPGTEGQIWSLQLIDNTLFCGHNYGCFVVEGFTARKISDIRGFWTFLQPKDKPEVLIAGTYSGLVKFEKTNEGWKNPLPINGFSESSRRLHYQDGRIWVEHGYKGLFELSFSEDFSTVENVDFFHNKAGLPAELPYNIQVFNNELYVSTLNGFYYFNSARRVFLEADYLNKIFHSKGFIDKIYHDKNRNIWYFSNEYMGVIRQLEDGNYIDITIPFAKLSKILLPAFQNIYIYDNKNVFIGSQAGLIHYDQTHIFNHDQVQSANIREVAFYDSNNSTYLLHSKSELEGTDDSKSIRIPYSANSVVFRYTLASYENPDALRFSYRLKSFDNDWSDWETKNFKEYTNLKEGSYTFEVKALNSHGSKTEANSFSFVIKPPFYRSKIAYAIYLLLLLGLLFANAYYIRKRIIKIKLKEKIRHEKKLARREQLFKEQSALSEKEIVQLRNEFLKNEMRHKNKELANATLLIVQKNKTLTYLKNDLFELLKKLPAEQESRQNLSNLLKKINRDLKNEKNWELFNSYFDDVHQDFINRIKEEFSDLTPKELRMCAYLRMNLSTKEIAPLMNISVRGVEISRYRLRKKLNIEHNQNLTEFILSY